MEELKIAFKNGRTAEINAFAHKLKSSCRSAGALKLGELYADIEQPGKDAQVEVPVDLMRRFGWGLAPYKPISTPCSEAVEANGANGHVQKNLTSDNGNRR